MPNNLDDKIAQLWKDVKYLHDEDARKQIKALILREIQFLEASHIVEESDVALTHGAAIKRWGEINLDALDIDQTYQKTWLVMDATISLLRSRGLIPFVLELKKKR